MKTKIVYILLTFSRILFAQNSVHDIDGNSYQTMRIDSTEWFVENLKTTRFANGDSIPTTQNKNLAISNETPQNYKWSPAGENELVKKQGYLYSWGAVIDKRGLCPTGWKIPSDKEWKILIDKIYTESNSTSVTEVDNPNFIYKKNNSSIEHPFLKEVAFAGGRMISGNYIFQQHFEYYWTSTLDYKGFAWMWYFSKSNVNHFNFEVNGGLSVRCMKSTTVDSQNR